MVLFVSLSLDDNFSIVAARLVFVAFNAIYSARYVDMLTMGSIRGSSFFGPDFRIVAGSSTDLAAALELPEEGVPKPPVIDPKLKDFSKSPLFNITWNQASVSHRLVGILITSSPYFAPRADSNMVTGNT